ncbi:MAG: Mu transposase C-terminal domain-containing protein, partial [Malacoplasma sp.]
NFINCTDWSTFKTLDDLNSKYQSYLNDKYINTHHSSIDTTPRIRFNRDYEQLRFVAPTVSVDELFMHSVDRKVATDATIRLENLTFEVPQKFIKQSITIKYFPNNLETAYIYDIYNKKIADIKQVNKIDNSKIKRNSISFCDIQGGNNNVWNIFWDEM